MDSDGSTDPVTERQKFMRLVLKGQVTMTEACRQFGISRKTGYKILTPSLPVDHRTELPVDH